MYGYFRTHRFNLAALAGLCFALFSFSSVAQQLPPGQGVSATWNPTTSHWQTNASTFRTPPGVTTSSSTTVGPVTRTPTGGAAQPMGSGITIQSIERTGPVSSILRTGPAALRTAVTRCLLNPICTATVTVGTLGLQELLDRYDWSNEEGQITETAQVEPEENLGIWYGNIGPNRFTGNSADSVCSQMSDYQCGLAPDLYYCPLTITNLETTSANCYGSGGAGGGAVFRDVTKVCPFPYVMSETFSCVRDVSTPVSSSDIEQAVNSDYDFNPSDWPVIGPHIPLNSADVEIEITSAPSLITPPVTTTQYDADGVPHTITETNIDYSFSPRPGTNPGPKPALDLEETTTTTSSTADGTVTGSETTTTTRPAGDTTPGNGSGGGSAPDTPWPAFCDWASVVCGWLDWTQEGWDQEEPDLPQLIDFAPEGDFEVGGSGECPAPYTINLGWMLNTSLEVSYQPFCDFAGLVKPLFLAFCYLFAGVITVRSL